MAPSGIQRRDGWALLGLGLAVLVSVAAFMGATSKGPTPEEAGVSRRTIEPQIRSGQLGPRAPILQDLTPGNPRPTAAPGAERRASAAQEEPAPSRSIEVSTWRMAGRAEDLLGAPVSGLGVRSNRDPSTMTRASTDGAGRFSLSVPAVGTGHLDVTVGSPFVLVAGSRVAQTEGAVVIVCRPRAPLTVQVFRAGSGIPLSQTAVEVTRTGQVAPLAPAVHAASTNAQGLCTFSLLPNCEGLIVEISRPGFVSKEIPLQGPEAESATLEVTLVPIAEAGRGSLTGQVLDPSGAGVSGAEIAAGRARTRSRADGTFELTLGSETPGIVHGYHPRLGTGHAPVVPSSIADGHSPVEINLLPIESPSAGSLVNPDGQSLSNVRVVPLDSSGAPNPLAAHWLTAQSDSEGMLSLPQAVYGEAGELLPLAVLDKDGAALGQLVPVDGGFSVQPLEPPEPDPEAR